MRTTPYELFLYALRTVTPAPAQIDTRSERAEARLHYDLGLDDVQARWDFDLLEPEPAGEAGALILHLQDEAKRQTNVAPWDGEQFLGSEPDWDWRTDQIRALLEDDPDLDWDEAAQRVDPEGVQNDDALWALAAASPEGAWCLAELREQHRMPLWERMALLDGQPDRRNHLLKSEGWFKADGAWWPGPDVIEREPVSRVLGDPLDPAPERPRELVVRDARYSPSVRSARSAPAGSDEASLLDLRSEAWVQAGELFGRSRGLHGWAVLQAELAARQIAREIPRPGLGPAKRIRMLTAWLLDEGTVSSYPAAAEALGKIRWARRKASLACGGRTGEIRYNKPRPELDWVAKPFTPPCESPNWVAR